jgi:NTP pyrophosphatase (non-canonical NTP hydrolase)
MTREVGVSDYCYDFDPGGLGGKPPYGDFNEAVYAAMEGPIAPGECVILGVCEGHGANVVLHRHADDGRLYFEHCHRPVPPIPVDRAPDAPTGPTAPAGPYSIGSTTWPGLSKVVEEAGELLQVAGKLVATGGERRHWDGGDLKARLEEELADLAAAMEFFADVNGLDAVTIQTRMVEKRKRFFEWHSEQGDR